FCSLLRCCARGLVRKPSARLIVFSRGSEGLVDWNRGGRCLADGSRDDRGVNNMPGLYFLFAIDVYAIAKVSKEANCEANEVQTEQYVAPEQGGDCCAAYGSKDCSYV